MNIWETVRRRDIVTAEH